MDLSQYDIPCLLFWEITSANLILTCASKAVWVTQWALSSMIEFYSENKTRWWASQRSVPFALMCIIKLDYYTVSTPQKDVPHVPCDGWNMMFNRVDIRVHLMHRAIYMLLKWISHCVTPVNIKLWATRGCRTKMLLEKGACVLMPWERFAGRMWLVVGCCKWEEIGCWLLRTGGGARKAVNRSVYCTSSPASTPSFICWVFLSWIRNQRSKISYIPPEWSKIQDPRS